MEYPTVICHECGKTDVACYTEPTGSQMIEQKLCFKCNFWTEWTERKDDPRAVRVEGKHYYANPEKEPSRWNGFGGARWKIRWRDGREDQTNDLWMQGEIPEHFRERLPDNADFIS